MTFKEKISTRRFWISVTAFTIVAFLIIANSFTLWWSYDFDFSAFKKDLPFYGQPFLMIAFELVKDFVLAFLVVLLTFKDPTKNSKEQDNSAQ